jgi:hypothetical protein
VSKEKRTPPIADPSTPQAKAIGGFILRRPKFLDACDLLLPIVLGSCLFERDA